MDQDREVKNACFLCILQKKNIAKVVKIVVFKWWSQYKTPITFV